ncbi:MAG: DUF6382 domain-containing protein [Eubacterium sp.]|nr:DUF6382 domain-containing protein [Eubacterium sp.]
MRYEYEDRNNHKYLCVTADNNEVRDCFACYMASENDIPGVLKVQFTTEKGVDVFKYDVTGLVTLDDYINRFSEYETLVNIMSRIIRIMDNLSNYVLAPNGVILSKYLVYVNEKNANIKLVYVPVKDLIPDMNSSIRTFFTSIISDCGIMNPGLKEISDYLVNSEKRNDVMEDMSYLLKKISSDSSHTAVLYSEETIDQSAISSAEKTQTSEKTGFSWGRKLFVFKSKEKKEKNDWNAMMNRMNIPR